MQDTENLAEFFLVALPGLEDVVQGEVRDWFPDFKTKVEHGGVTVWAPLEDGLAMNLALKTATRILLRLTTFRCRDFPKLFNKVAHLKWEKWIDPACDLEVHVSTRLSRVKIKKRIEDTCEDAWQAHKDAAGIVTDRSKKAALYVRFLNDDCTLSLDTSGERLHKRGVRQNIGEAPLRETIAAALIQLVERKFGAGDQPVELVDPMMGSGTFLLEAEARDKLVDRREFAFETFARQPKSMPQLHKSRVRIESLIGFEMDSKAMKAAKANMKSVKKEFAVSLKPEDFLTATPLAPAGSRRRWLFANPPYGERLKVKEPLAGLYVKLFAAAERVVKPDLACFILPSKSVKGKFTLPPGWKVLEKRPFLNGGIPVVAFVFGRTNGAPQS